MVMVPLTSLDGLVPEGAISQPRRDEAFLALQVELLKVSDEMASKATNALPEAKAVAEAAASIISDLAGEAVSPCVRAFGPNVDPWDERLQHLRGMSAMCGDVILEGIIAETGVDATDPRIERLKLIAADIARLVSSALEESIEAAKPETKSAGGPTI